VPFERIDVGDEHPAEAVLRDQLQHRDLLAVETRHRGCRAGRAGPSALGERFDDRRMGHVAPAVPARRHELQLVEYSRHCSGTDRGLSR